MSKRYEEGDYLFDGFAHRSYNESMDGWRNALADPDSYDCVKQANSVLDLFEDLQIARRRIWELEREVAILRPLLFAHVGSPEEISSQMQP